jgi:CBS domain-containing protein
MIFGADLDKGIRLNGLNPEVVELGDGITEDDLLVHDETNRNLAYMLTQMNHPEFPVPFGVLYRVLKTVYEDAVVEQIAQAQAKKGKPNLKLLFESDYIWKVTADDSRSTSEIRDTAEMLAVTLDEEYMDEMVQHLDGDKSDGKTDVHESLRTDLLSNLLHADRDVITVKPKASLSDTIALMQDRNIGSLVVVDANKRPIGIFTEADVLRKVATQIEDLSAHTVAEFMTRNPDVLHADTPIAHALHLMSIHRYRHLPIVDEHGVVVDVISFRDVVYYLETHFADSD